MRLAALKPDGLGLVVDDSVVELSDALVHDGLLPASADMVDLIERYDTIADRLTHAATTDAKVNLDTVRLRAPVARPPKLWCAAGNYQRESSGMGEARGRGGASDMNPDHPDFQVALGPGDRLQAEIEGIGALHVGVVSS